jgi:hypothetical protein
VESKERGRRERDRYVVRARKEESRGWGDVCTVESKERGREEGKERDVRRREMRERRMYKPSVKSNKRGRVLTAIPRSTLLTEVSEVFFSPS